MHGQNQNRNNRKYIKNIVPTANSLLFSLRKGIKLIRKKLNTFCDIKKKFPNKAKLKNRLLTQTVIIKYI